MAVALDCTGSYIVVPNKLAAEGTVNFVMLFNINKLRNVCWKLHHRAP